MLWRHKAQPCLEEIGYTRYNSTGNRSAKEKPPQETQKKLEKLLNEYSEVFQNEIGTLKSIKAKLTLKENSQPKFYKARPVPYAMKPKVEVNLKRLEEEGILSKVKFSNWATPIVLIVKPNGTVRTCGDYKITVNPQLHSQRSTLSLALMTYLLSWQRSSPKSTLDRHTSRWRWRKSHKSDKSAWQSTPIKDCTDTIAWYLG